MKFDPEKVRIQLVTDSDTAFKFMNWVREVPDQLIGLDVETDGLDWFDGRLRLVQFGTMTEGWAVPFEEWPGLVKDALTTFDARNKVWVGHNFKFDLHWIERRTGWLPRDWRFVHDTMMLAGVLNSSAAKGLKDLSEHYVWKGAKDGQKALKDDMKKGGWTWGTVPVDLPSYWVYGVLDTIITVALFYTLLEKGTAAGVMDAYTVEMGAFPVLYAMERKGMLVDSEHCHAEQNQLLGRADEIEEAVTRFGIDNIGSTAQITMALQEVGIELTEKTESGRWKMDKDTFDIIAATNDHELLHLIQEYRSIIKLSSTYYSNFLKYQRSDGRCHPFYWAAAAKTGRMSATEPAILTVPRPDEDKSDAVRAVRNSFVAPDGHVLISTDFSNVEARIFAHFAQEHGMIDAFNQGINLHKFTASQIFGKPIEDIDKAMSEYTIAKNTLFCLPMATKALTQNGTKSVDELNIGDMVAGYNAHGFIEWTPVRAIHRPGQMEVITFGNKHRQFRATGNHRWICEKRIDGEWNNVVMTTDEFVSGNGDHRLRLAAQFDVEDRSGLSVSQAGLLGWLITDGHVRWSDVTSGLTSQMGGLKTGVQGYIAQTKPIGRREIEESLWEFIRHTTPGGYDIKPQAIRDVFSTVGLERDYSNLMDIVLSMGREQISSFCAAVWWAEGHLDGNRIGQNAGSKYDAIRLAVFMNGSFPSRGLVNKTKYPTSNVNMTFTRGLPTMSSARVSVTDRRIEEVWCITTDLDSFVAVDGDTYFLSGNCTLFGGGAAKIAMTAGITLAEGKAAQDGLYRAFPGIKAFQKRSTMVATDNLHAHGQAFIRGVDGRILAMAETDDRYYAFTNWQIQSTANVVLKQRLAVIDNMGLAEFMIAAIHDEVVAEIPEDFEEEYRILIEEAMSDDSTFSLPIVCATGDGAVRWGDAK